MDTDVAYRVIGDLVEVGTVWLTITGGEPTLHPDFVEIYTLAAESGLVQSLFTNGSALEFETLDLQTHNPPRLLQVPMYGATPETVDARLSRPWRTDHAWLRNSPRLTASIFVMAKSGSFSPHLRRLAS